MDQEKSLSLKLLRSPYRPHPSGLPPRADPICGDAEIGPSRIKKLLPMDTVINPAKEDKTMISPAKEGETIIEHVQEKVASLDLEEESDSEQEEESDSEQEEESDSEQEEGSDSDQEEGSDSEQEEESDSEQEEESDSEQEEGSDSEQEEESYYDRESKVGSQTYRNRPIYWASMYGHIECVKALLEHGVDQRAQNDYASAESDTPLERVKKVNLMLEDLRREENEIIRRREALELKKNHLIKDLTGVDGDDNLCVICLDRVKSVALMPCKHMCICSDAKCSDSLQLCPLCRTEITDRIALFV